MGSEKKRFQRLIGPVKGIHETKSVDMVDASLGMPARASAQHLKGSKNEEAFFSILC